MTSQTHKLRIRHYKLNFLEKTRTAADRANVARFLLANNTVSKFTVKEIAEIVNNQLPPKQKPWEPVEEDAKPDKKAKRAA